MDVHKRLKLASVFLIIAFVLKLIGLVSPGWAMISIHFPIDRNEEIEREIKMRSEDSAPAVFDLKIGEIHEGKKLMVSLGIWYFIACVGNVRHKAQSNWPEIQYINAHTKCYYSGYGGVNAAAERVDKNEAVIRGTLHKIGAIAKFGLLEFQIETSLGIAFATIGLVCLILYKKSGAKRRNLGLAACIGSIITGVLHLVVVGRIASDLCHLHEMLNLYYGGMVYGVHVPIPWCLVVITAAAILSFVAAFISLSVLSREKNDKEIQGEIYYTGNDVKHIPDQSKFTYFPSEKIDLPSFPTVTDPLPKKHCQV